MTALIALSTVILGFLGTDDISPIRQQGTSQGPASGRAQAASESKNAEKIEIWKGILEALCVREEIAMVFDLNPENVPPRSVETRLGSAGLEILGELTARPWSQVEGVQVFARDLYRDRGTSYASLNAELDDFLRSLGPERVARLVGHGLPISQVPPGSRWFLRKLMNDFSTSGPGLALGAWDKTVLRIQPRLAGEFIDPKTERKNSVSLIKKAPSAYPTEEEIALALADAEPLESIPLAPEPMDGELRFVPGEVLSLHELIARASEAFGKRYLYDQRLKESLVFVRGSFTDERFLRCLQLITRIPPVQETIRDERTQQEAFDDLLRGPLAALTQTDVSEYTDASLTFRDFLAGKSMKLEDFWKGSEYTQRTFASNNLPGHLEVKLTSWLSLQVATLVTGPDRYGNVVTTWQGGVALGFPRGG